MEETSAIDQRARPSPLPRVVRFRFLLEAVEPILLPAYAGSIWRGLIGLGLRRTACLTHQPTCDGCLLRHACVYSVLFESPAQDPADAPRYKELPHPVALEISQDPQREVGAGDPITLGINLIGPAIEQMPYLIHALQTAGRHGAGQTRGRFMLGALERETSLGDADWVSAYRTEHGQYLPPGPATTPPPPPTPDSVRMHLDTPLRLKRRGHLVGPTELDAQDLLLNLCARLGLLASHYGGDPAAFDWGRFRRRLRLVPTVLRGNAYRSVLARRRQRCPEIQPNTRDIGEATTAACVPTEDRGNETSNQLERIFTELLNSCQRNIPMVER